MQLNYYTHTVNPFRLVEAAYVKPRASFDTSARVEYRSRDVVSLKGTFEEAESRAASAAVKCCGNLIDFME